MSETWWALLVGGILSGIGVPYDEVWFWWHYARWRAALWFGLYVAFGAVAAAAAAATTAGRASLGNAALDGIVAATAAHALLRMAVRGQFAGRPPTAARVPVAAPDGGAPPDRVVERVASLLG